MPRRETALSEPEALLSRRLGRRRKGGEGGFKQGLTRRSEFENIGHLGKEENFQFTIFSGQFIERRDLRKKARKH
jgi:hypothetical protein